MSPICLLLNIASLVSSSPLISVPEMFTVPEVVCYKATDFSYRLAKWMIKVKFISLVNLIMDREVVKELIQADLTENNLVKELDQLLHNAKRQRKLLEDYVELKDRLGNAGASERAATVIMAELKSKT